MSVTLEMVRELLTKDEPDVEVANLEEEPGSGRGDNYTSMLYRVKAKGRRRVEAGREDRWVEWERAILYKVMPQSKERREAFKSESLFRNEVVFYTRVWPALSGLQADGRAVFDGVAKVYVAKSDLIVMEDLRERGFRMADRRKGLQLEDLKLVLKALAGFHALSLTLRETRPEEYARLADSSSEEAVQEGLFRRENEDWYRQYYRVAANNAIKMVSDGLSARARGHERDGIMAKLKAFLDEKVFFRAMCELSAAQGPLSVFCHGDCWTNNILFGASTSSTSSPLDAKAVYFVDFQLSRVGSLALDLVNVLYCCTSGEVRRAHMTHLLRYYHFNLLSSLHTLNPDSNQSPIRDPTLLWELLTEEIRRCGRFGVGLALDILPISTCASDAAPDLYEGEEANEGQEVRIRGPPPPGAECTALMTDLVLELVQNNAL